MRALKVSYSDVGEGRVSVNCEKTLPEHHVSIRPSINLVILQSRMLRELHGDKLAKQEQEKKARMAKFSLAKDG